jgi:arginyl-tRNA synthetase
LSVPCFPLARTLRRAPAEIAADLAAAVKLPAAFRQVSADGAYLNFFIDPGDLIAGVVGAVRAAGASYGSNRTGTGRTALLEHTSINPNASPHVGRARNALIGDVLARLLRFEGYDLQVRYFVNDVGKQIALLVLAAGDRPVPFTEVLDLYVQANARLEQEPNLERQTFELLRDLERGDTDARRRFDAIVDVCVAGQRAILEALDIRHDRFDKESEYLWSGRTREVIERLRATGRLSTDEDGRSVLDLDGYDLPSRNPVVVLERSDGTSMYQLRDIAYTLDKIDSGADRNLIVLGEDQRLHHRQLTAALDLLGGTAPEVVHYAFLSLDDASMSTRSGNVVLLEEFMAQAVERAGRALAERGVAFDRERAEAVAHGAIRYSILRVANEKMVRFDFEEALSFEGDTGPYLLYGHARMCALLRRHGQELPESADFSLLADGAELALAKAVAGFPDAVARTLREASPHVVADYLYGLTRAFTAFYHACPVLDAPAPLRDGRLLLVDAARQTLRNGMLVLGMRPLERK